MFGDTYHVISTFGLARLLEVKGLKAFKLETTPVWEQLTDMQSQSLTC